MYRAADRTIVQVEEIISNEEVRAEPWKTTIPAADAIVRTPFGAHPFYSRGYYVQDIDHLREYSDAAAAMVRGDPQSLAIYLDRYCREPATHADYLERIGIKRLLALHEY
jgi:glutaconate CoA-transferase subunit A